MVKNQGRIKIHDKYQLEIVFDWNTSLNQGEVYLMDIFFFIPKNILAGPPLYDEDKFYQNITNNLRLHTPWEWSKETHLINKLRYLISYSEFLDDPERKKFRQMNGVVKEIKLVGCYIDTLLKRMRKQIPYDQIHDQLTDSAIQKDIHFLAKQIHSFRKNYLIPIKNHPNVSKNVKDSLLLIDEYNSHQYQYSLAFALNYFSNEVNNGFHKEINKLLKDEAKYQKKLKYVILSQDLNHSEREVFFHRRGLLKKFVYDILYLETIKINRTKSYQNFIGSLAAFLAACWAAFAEYQRFKMAQGQSLDVSFSYLLILGVVAYVFKDRLKEISKEFFHEKIKNFIPDMTTKILYRSLKGSDEKIEIGRHHENIHYLPPSALPEDVIMARKIDQNFEFEPDRKEHILNYFKKVELNQRNLKKHMPHISSVKDILRFDISDFLLKLGDSQRSILYYDTVQGPSQMEVPKVYHLNIVLKYTIGKKKKKRVTHLEKARVIFNKEGILRIEFFDASEKSKA